MLLRPRQKTFVERSVRALDEHRDTLGVAPTGAGKTIMFSSVVGRLLSDGCAKAAVLAHRDELTTQNVAEFGKINPSIKTSIVDARTKSWDGQTVFAMAPTLARETNLRQMPWLDLLVIDEAHHAAADSYRRIIDFARDRNPELLLYGVTATPNRGDRRGLRDVFSNVADQVSVGELIADGHLVPPRTFVIDLKLQEPLREVAKGADDFDMQAVDAIMNRTPINEEVVRHWREKAGDRQTVVFCSTVEHARNITAAFKAAGVPVGFIHGEMGDGERRSMLGAYGAGELRVIVNVSVLTEGWDHPPTSCVVLLRPSSYKSTMIQMIGRGLRPVDPGVYPGIVKNDCIVLDFGISTLLHGSLEQDVDLDGKTSTVETPTKDCPECGRHVRGSTRECPLCGYVWVSGGADPVEVTPLANLVMSEIDLLQRSSFRWIGLFGDDTARMAAGFNAWAGIFAWNGRWYAVGGAKGQRARLLGIGEWMVCLAAANDWLNRHETDESAHKTRSWLNQPPTAKQLARLPAEYQMDFGLNRYRASVLLSFKFNRAKIQNLVFGAGEAVLEAAE